MTFDIRLDSTVSKSMTVCIDIQCGLKVNDSLISVQTVIDFETALCLTFTRKTFSLLILAYHLDP